MTYAPAVLPVLTLADLSAATDRLDLVATGVPRRPLLVLDLDRLTQVAESDLARAEAWLAAPGTPIVGVCRGPWTAAARRLAPSLDVTLTSDDSPPVHAVRVPEPERTLTVMSEAAQANPLAAAALVQVLRLTPRLAVPEALVVESLAYSMLLAGPEFRQWRERTARRRPPEPGSVVRLSRNAGRLHVTLDHPARRNAYGRAVRDGLVEAFDLAAADPTVREVLLDGAGPAFCSGGDLDEFGTMNDVTAAHLVRLRQGAAAALARIGDRVTVQLHGPCIGAGIEIPAFAGHIRAAPETSVRLPELAMGLIPGAGGTVGLPRRIGRWRTAYLALTGGAVGVTTAREWGLVDEVGRG